MHDPQHHTDPLAGLLDRYSVGTKHLADPAPSLDELRHMAAAALRAPDHAGLVPFRFAAIRGQARGRLADLFEQAALIAGKGTEDAGRDRHRALDAPLLVAVIARIDPGHPVATLHEQWMAVGGALTNLLNAVHALGYAGKMLSGSKVRAVPVVAAFCEPGEQLVGWVVMGTAQRPGTPKFHKPAPDALMREWP